MKFSERVGLVKPKTIIQSNSMDDDLRNSLWSTVYLYVLEPLDIDYRTANSDHHIFLIGLWQDFFKKPIDEIPSFLSSTVTKIKTYFFSCEWYNVYDFIEYLIQNGPLENRSYFIQDINLVLKQELSGYRVVNESITSITSDAEIQSIEEAINNSLTSKLRPVNSHLKTALSSLSNKKNPDYRNAIKEAISAVESLCKILTNDNSASLGGALKVLKSKIEIHSSFEQALQKLYGYTSNADGIRHGSMNEPNLDQEDAIFMLISCSAFVNYLLVKADKANLLPKS